MKIFTKAKVDRLRSLTPPYVYPLCHLSGHTISEGACHSGGIHCLIARVLVQLMFSQEWVSSPSCVLAGMFSPPGVEVLGSLPYIDTLVLPLTNPTFYFVCYIVSSTSPPLSSSAHNAVLGAAACSSCGIGPPFSFSLWLFMYSCTGQFFSVPMNPLYVFFCS